MSGLFEHIEMFDEGDKVVTRQAIAAANKRFNNAFAPFLRQASTKKEFESRLALVETDVNNMVADVVNEYGGDADKIAAAIKNSVSMIYTASCDCDGDCEGMCKCGGCDDCKCDSKKTAGEMTPAAEPCENCGDEGCEHCTGDPEATKTSAEAPKEWRDEDKEEWQDAQQDIQYTNQTSQVAPWLTKQVDGEDQEDGGNRKSNTDKADEQESWEKDAQEHEDKDDEVYDVSQPGPHDGPRGKAAFIESQPVANPVPLAESQGYTAGGASIEESLESAPSAVGTGKESAVHKVEEKDEKFYVTEKGEGEVAGPFDSSEDAHARANELNDLENKEKEDDKVEEGEATGGEGKGPHKVQEKDDEFVVTEEHAGEVTSPVKDKEKAEEKAERLNELENLEKDSSVTPAMVRALALKEAAGHNDDHEHAEHKEDHWVNEGDTVIHDGEEKKVENIEQEGDEKVVKLDDGSTVDIESVEVKESKLAAETETGDKTEEREELPTGDEDALGGPSPKIDKEKWVPNATNPDGNLEPIDTEGENSPVPTRHMDIKQKPDYKQDTLENLVKYDNNVWEREQLPTAEGDEAGFETTRNIDQPHTETFPDKGQAEPVTRQALATMDKSASFRVFLNDIGMSQADFRNASDEQKSKLWDIYNNYEMPKYTEEEGLDVPLSDETDMVDALEAPAPETLEETQIEEPVEETPEAVEDIIEREDKEDDRVEVAEEPFVEEGVEDFEDVEPDEFAEGPSPEELEDLIREIEENPEDWQ